MTPVRVLAFICTGLVLFGAVAWLALQPGSGPSAASSLPDIESSAENAVPAAVRELSYGPVPGFVQPVALPEGVGSGPASATGLRFHVLDIQHSEAERETVHYYRYVLSASSLAGLNAISTIVVPINPNYQRIVVHDALVTRGDETQSRTGRISVDFIRTEADLAHNIITGQEIALVLIEDVRVGDLLDLSFSLVGALPPLGAARAQTFFLQLGVPVEQFSLRSIWPRGAAHRVLAGGEAFEPAIERRGGNVAFVWSPRPADAVSVEGGAPLWYQQVPSVMISSWPDWASVARWAAPFYRTRAVAEPEVAEIAEVIAAEHAGDAARTVAALQFVQDEIRYLAVLLGDGGYVPSTPSETLRRRTGDCKDKTLLLLSLLDALGIEAYPVIANTEAGRALDGAVPAPGAFNHVLVQVRIRGEIFWLEPAARYQRGRLHNRSQPDYGLALVLDGEATGLVAMKNENAPARSIVMREAFELLQAGPDAPSQWTMEVELRGAFADEWRELIGEAGLAALQDYYDQFYASYLGSAEQDEPLRLEDDEDSNLIALTGSWQAGPLFGAPRADGRRYLNLRAHALQDVLGSLSPDRSTPVAVAYPLHARHIIEGGIDVPGGNFWEFEDSEQSLSNDAFDFHQSLVYYNGMLTLSFEQRTHQPMAELDDEIIAHAREMREALRYHLHITLNPPEDGAEKE
ncbi:MAG: DUF3857 domain-containing transglutaminase family protein [Oceanicaulis sp.]|uniref:DUF3857 domain-containing transglutaminase family protein n=1 Tax=Glycocaulis sp. TaxID=1969725 RepID=UPI0025BB5988|nr:DUF3857 domain-containing transglutaminase family protein [Glycocaulis sp.]MCC5981889.1 DUF3857 domain-containing transglutaminase family protein [Oceanicaulis sp.]MCH8522801.1 DUF3857 domain-containing transglutaminase family protein [Glycocaulis sp.]